MKHRREMNVILRRNNKLWHHPLVLGITWILAGFSFAQIHLFCRLGHIFFPKFRLIAFSLSFSFQCSVWLFRKQSIDRWQLMSVHWQLANIQQFPYNLTSSTHLHLYFSAVISAGLSDKAMTSTLLISHMRTRFIRSFFLLFLKCCCCSFFSVRWL